MITKPFVDEDQLLAKIAGKDHFAFKILYEKYYELIFKFSFRLLQCESSAEEVIQDTMLQIWQLGDKLRTINNIEAFIKTIARRRAIDQLRIQQQSFVTQKGLLSMFNAVELGSNEGFSLESAYLALEKGIEKLPNQQRLVYQLCYQQGLKYQEVADRLHISHGTVQTHMKLALKFLREYIRQYS
ncbi:RNA polymerase sigma factor [Sphingobacterium spiritivorum]|uniref:RNA polymerase sigma factor n=1 Tax=Sphingobacterium spiritivorum TaxID=258 RepID=UPI003DA3688D